MNLVCLVVGHRWIWLSSWQVSTIGDPYGGETFNVGCERCGKTTWAHGRMPW